MNKTETVTLESLSSRVVRVPLLLPSDTPPQQDELHIIFSVNETVLQPVLREAYTIPQHTELFISNKDERSNFLQYTTVITYMNTGNVPTPHNVTLPSHFFESIFTRTNAEHSYTTRDGQRMLIATFSIPPGESKELKIIKDYRPPVIASIVILILLALYFFFKGAIKVNKQATILSYREGGISEIKITLHILNKTNKEFNQVQIKDILPSLAQLSKDGMGILKPTEVQHLKRGTKLSWNLHKLEPKDERIITYKIRTRLTILGGFILTKAQLTYHDDKGNKFVAESKRVRVVGD